MAGRLVAFGCSITHGDTLPDCYIADQSDPLGYRAGPNPSLYAWPGMAAGLLGMACLNLGRSGNSNTRILMDVLRHDWQPGDVAAVLWTYIQRDVLFRGDGMVNVGPWNAVSCNLSNGFFQAHDPSDMQTRSWMAHHHAGLYLRSKGVPFVMASTDEWLQGHWPGYDLRAIPHGSFVKPFMDLGLDGQHPGISTHRQWGELFAQGITNLAAGPSQGWHGSWWRPRLT